MRPASSVLACFMMIAALATARAQEGGILNPDGITRPNAVRGDRSIIIQMNPVPPRDASPFTPEGLLTDAKGERLTWARAYALALIRSQDKGKPLAPKLDPKVVDDEVGKLAGTDFARFRKEFLAVGPATFRDPSARFYDLLARAQGINHAALRLSASEHLLILLQELVRGESSGLTQVHIDQLSGTLQQAQGDLLARRHGYRDAVDEFKVELGLSPQAPIWLDQSPLLKFRDTFEALDRWFADPSREFQQLDAMVQSLPGLGDLTIEGRSLQVLNWDEFADLERFVNDAGRLALARGGPSAELDARKRTRKLSELLIRYEIERRNLVMTLRRKSMTQEQLFAPPKPGQADSATVLAELREIQNRLLQCQDRLVETWTNHHAIRLALARDLNLLPVDSWKAFQDQMLGGKPDPSKVRPVPQPARMTPPAPPASPFPMPPPPVAEPLPPPIPPR